VAVAGISRTLEDIDERWRSAVVGSAIAAIEVISVGEGVGFVGRTARVRLLHHDCPRVSASVCVTMQGDGAVREIGVAQRIDERAVPYRVRAWFAGGNREVG
jgi:hypothetical protein